MAPPRIGTPLQVRLSDEVVEQIDAYAAGRGLSRSAAIRELILTALPSTSTCPTCQRQDAAG